MAMAKRSKENDAWVRTFEVTEPTRHRKGFTVYKVISTVFPRSFPESASKITVWKRYSDFKKLHKDLEQIFKQLYLRGEFPSFPKAKVFGRFEHEVVEERRRAALVLLEFTAKHTQLFTSKAFNSFFEDGYKSEEFIGKILFSRVNDGSDEPPRTVLQERSEINTPCLEPEVLWNPTCAKSPTEDDNTSLSLSSISSSLSPDNPDPLPLPNGGPMPCSSTSDSAIINSPSNSVNAEQVSASNMALTSTNGVTAKLLNSTVSTLNSVVSSSRSDVSCDYVNLPSSSKASVSSRSNGIVRSATVTDDLSSYFDDEFEDAAFLFPTGSCASLDTLPGCTPSNDDSESVHSKGSISSHRNGLFSLQKKANGFGFFDFLPLFPKRPKSKPKPKKENEEVGKKDLLSVGYICEAAGHFAVAQFHESNTEYQDAFSAYKEGIRVLLAGAQDDTDRDRKLLAKNKLEKYLSRAESLKEMYLSPGSFNEGTGGISPVFSSPNKKKYLSSLRKSDSNEPSNGLSLLSTLEELKRFKVVGRGPLKSNLLIVMNPEEQLPKCYAVKVLWKSPCIIFPDKPTIIPNGVPFMTKLVKWFETSDKIVLLLEYIGGGRLIDFVTNYQSKRISFVSPPEDMTPVDDQPVSETNVGSISDCLRNVESVVVKAEELTQGPSKILPVKKEDVHNDNGSQALSTHATTFNVHEINSTEECKSDNTSECSLLPGTIPPSVTPLSSEMNGGSHNHETDVHSNVDLLEVSKLLENSKALLQTVTKTLEEGNSPRKLSKSKLNDEKSDNSGLDGESSLIEISDQFNSEPIETDEGQPCAEPSSVVVGQAPAKDTSPVEDIEEPIVPKRMVPDGCIREWAAEMILALESLHEAGITYGDLDINDILLGENGHISLRYKGLWKDIDDPIPSGPYMAPEVRNSIGVPLWKIHFSADWWSLGAILFCFFTGLSFHAAHSEGIFPEMIIKIPDTAISGSSISRSAKTLLSELLQYAPALRLGYYGAAEIKTHPFFDGFDWEKTLEEGSDLRNE